MNEKVIVPIPVTHPDVQKYGQKVAYSESSSPDSCGEGWKCWFLLASLEGKKQWNIGIVEADLPEPIIKLVESHPTRKEWVFAIDAPIIQTVALEDQLHPGHADVSTARAILLLPGQGILINEGIWHAAGFPVNLRHALYGFVLAPADPEVKEVGMIPFCEGNHLRISL